MVVQGARRLPGPGGFQEQAGFRQVHRHVAEVHPVDAGPRHVAQRAPERVRRRLRGLLTGRRDPRRDPAGRRDQELAGAAGRVADRHRQQGFLGFPGLVPAFLAGRVPTALGRGVEDRVEGGAEKAVHQGRRRVVRTRALALAAGCREREPAIGLAPGEVEIEKSLAHRPKGSGIQVPGGGQRPRRRAKVLTRKGQPAQDLVRAGAGEDPAEFAERGRVRRRVASGGGEPDQQPVYQAQQGPLHHPRIDIRPRASVGSRDAVARMPGEPGGQGGNRLGDAIADAIENPDPIIDRVEVRFAHQAPPSSRISASGRF